ncbi:hypothetical protein BGY98DRAFT_1042041 [Russula aff. rugulosa BPL654]|nr:hypothetical protein BGY98DRAFT_1042041 [Russula aff. rugulosa BPL654]
MQNADALLVPTGSPHALATTAFSSALITLASVPVTLPATVIIFPAPAVLSAAQPTPPTMSHEPPTPAFLSPCHSLRVVHASTASIRLM